MEEERRRETDCERSGLCLSYGCSCTSRKSLCCWLMSCEMRPGSACRLPSNVSSLVSSSAMRFSMSSPRSFRSEISSYMMFCVCRHQACTRRESAVEERRNRKEGKEKGEG